MHLYPETTKLKWIVIRNAIKLVKFLFSCTFKGVGWGEGGVKGHEAKFSALLSAEYLSIRYTDIKHHYLQTRKNVDYIGLCVAFDLQW